MKQMIWSSYDLLDETAKEEYQNSQREILDDDSYEVSDEEWAEEVYRWLDDERSNLNKEVDGIIVCLLYTSPSPRDKRQSRMPSSA